MTAPHRAGGRTARSGRHSAGSLEEFHEWWADRHLQGRFHVEQIPFSELDSWSFEADTGNLAHVSGRFFTIEGLQVRDNGRDIWSQPIINQPEIGILGIIVKEFDGVLHCLMQAKMEPGNINTLQLSPTVQATRSNYTQVHRGMSTRYLEYFIGPGRGQILVDVLQSEQGAWFWRKRNRNMVVLVTDDIPPHDDYRWLSLEQIRELNHSDHLINMDARTVLSCMPFPLPDESQLPTGDPFRDALIRSCQYQQDGVETRHTSGEILSWFTEAKTRCHWTARLTPLAKVSGWTRDDVEIADEHRQHFRIVAVSVEAGTREVQRWTQPLLFPRGEGRAVFIVRIIDGVLHVLVQGRPEYGLMDLVEMAPTVHLLPGTGVSAVEDPFLREVLVSRTATVRYDQVLSEEGGRFYNALTRYQITEVGEEVPLDPPRNYCWMTVRQLMDLLRHGHYLNIEARSLLACLHSLY
ncbi:NDP-hexose 2,3-dehydratase family protein (plasmid) [Streptomyces atratus]|uniref:Oxidase EvaA n=1 Tax=Streptomyces atratus TaxID=1893 RepID=A0A1K1ZTJ3_STRAR|nr:NDP-hexose 2,3-dehydratase family protein [Streptomyces atratus]SFX77463.1 oxidase EvaA [Streptomyces atratus]